MKRIIFLMLILFIGINAQQQSKYANYPGLVFREVMNNQTDTRENGGVPTSVTYQNGSAVCVSANSSKIIFNKPLKGIYTIRIRLSSLSAVNGSFLFDANSRDLGNSGSILTSSTTITSSGYVDGANYIDGVLSSTISAATREIVVSGVGLKLQSFFINCRYSSTLFNTASYDFIEIYNRALSASEIKNLYDGVAYKDLQSNTSEVLGSELVTNGGFDGDASWTKQTGWTISNGKANFDGLDGFSIYQGQVITSGELYKIVYTISGYVSGGMRTIAGGVNGQTRTANGTYTEYRNWVLGSANLFLQSVGETWLSVDNVSIKKVLSASTPLLIDFNSTGGLVKSSVGNVWTSSNATTKRAGAIWSSSFNGTTSYLSTPNVNLSGNITVCGWFRANKYGQNDLGNIWNDTKLIVRINTTNSVLQLSRDGSTYASSATNAITLGRTYYYAITSTSSGVTNFYIKDVKDAPILSGTANQSAGTPANGSTILIGNNSTSSPTRTFNGIIPMGRIYGSILTLPQIVNIWSSKAWMMN